MTRKPRSKILRHLPSVGSSLTGKFWGNEYHAVIVEDPNSTQGKAVKYEGVLYKSLTAAAKAITKQPTNGWRFWKF